MPPTCTVCRHPQRQDIESLLAAGTPLRNIAERFATSATALHRHKAHVKAVLAKARETREVALGDSLADQLRSIHAKTLALLDRAEAADDHRTMLAAIREARANIGGLLTLQQAVGGPQKIIVMVKDERDLPVGRAVPVVRSDEDLELVHQGRARELPHVIPQDSIRSLPASSPQIRASKPTAPNAPAKALPRRMTLDEVNAAMDEAVARVRDRAGLMGPRHFGPPEDRS